jgi:hypothetical protein
MDHGRKYDEPDDHHERHQGALRRYVGPAFGVTIFVLPYLP